ncbi:MAG: riboflavin biosynthesis protein RibD [Flavobacteriaceae bacterium]|nr:riboflavin biosynthesis protein RibD [Flavobacteriaceae bacterium]
MARCIQLAKNGLGATYPNPLVGSVIVHNSTIIGEGWHQRAGLPHAEVNALTSVRDTALLNKATLYVSLEPCSHFGRTPPCADRIIESGIRKVVIGSTDPNPQVAGRGIKKLMEAGCDVVVGVLEDECVALNKRFFTFHDKKRPYIFLKWAQTQDGFIAPLKETRNTQQPVWITGSLSRQLSHKLRTTEQAILVGTNTVLDDNPSLTSREWHGANPLRVILDRSGKIDGSAKVFDSEAPTLLLTETGNYINEKVLVERITFTKNLASQICDVLYRHTIHSLIVEGGQQTLSTFINANLWDEALVFTGSENFGEGVPAPRIDIKEKSSQSLQGDVLHHYKNHNR